MMKKLAVAIMMITALFVMSALAERPPSGQLWLNEELVSTLVPPANVPAGSGTDPLYMVSTQSNNVAGVGPGESGYHGGRWQVWVVSWNDGVTPYELHSDEDVTAAQEAGHITLTRNEAGDNRCPLQPGKS